MGREVCPAFQRRYRDTPSSNLGVRLAETESRHGSKRNARFGEFVRGITRVSCRVLARAPGAPIIRIRTGLGSNIASQRPSREPLSAILSVRLAAAGPPEVGGGCTGPNLATTCGNLQQLVTQYNIFLTSCRILSHLVCVCRPVSLHLVACCNILCCAVRTNRNKSGSTTCGIL
eukprot:gene14498-biopygen15673